MPDPKFKVPPHNEEAERAVLGAMFLDETAVMTVRQYLKPDDFYFNAHRRVCEAVFKVFDGGHRPDILTVSGELQKTGMLEEAGGLDNVASMSNAVPSTANVEYYARSVQDCALKRALIRVAGTVGIEAYDDSAEARVLLEDTQKQLFELFTEHQTAVVKSVKELLPGTIATLEKAMKEKKNITGIPSGFEELDKRTSGFQNEELIVIGARPSMGKTALALTMATHIAVEKRIPAAFFTLEMSGQLLMHRIMSAGTMIESEKLRTGFFHTNDFPRIWEASGKLAEAPLFIADMPNMRMSDLRAYARQLREQQKVEIIFIDYLGLIAGENTREARFMPRWEQMGEISRSLKQLARELKIPIVVLSQLTREAEKEKPSLASIRESGSIEQDADVVMFLHGQRDTDKSPEEQASETAKEVELILMKQRNGPTGTIKLVFLKPYTKFVPSAGNQQPGY